MFWRSQKTALSGFGHEVQSVRQRVLRERLIETLETAARVLIDDHCLSDVAADEVWQNVARLKIEIDDVLLRDSNQRTEAEPPLGGEIIANSADAFSHAAAALGDVELEQSIGSVRDARTIGHIFWQLGFDRQGQPRTPSPA